jgi:elongation factor Tu
MINRINQSFIQRLRYALCALCIGTLIVVANTMYANTNVGVIGKSGDGKGVLAAALQNFTQEAGEQRTSVDDMDNTKEEQERGITIFNNFIQIKYNNRDFALIDVPGDADFTKNAATGMAQMDAAILVVSATDGPMSQTINQLLLAKTIGIKHIIVFLNKADLIEDARQFEPVEQKVRELLSAHGLPYDTPVIRGSALLASQGDTDVDGVPSVKELLAAMHKNFPLPNRDTQSDFMLQVNHVFTGMSVVVGQVERGTVKKGDQVEIVGLSGTDKHLVTVDNIQINQKNVNTAEAGDSIGLLINDDSFYLIERGHVLAKPDTVKAYTKFKADLHLFPKEQGGRNTPIFTGHKPHFFFKTKDITGKIALPENKEMHMPGESAEITVELLQPTVTTEGKHFLIMEGKGVIGIGTITEILE